MIKDGVTMGGVQVVDDSTIIFETDIGDHEYQIQTGYFGQGVAMTAPVPMSVAGASSVAAIKRTAEENARAAKSMMLSGGSGCPCCGGSV